MSASQGLERAAFAAIVLFTSACSRPSSNSTSTAASNEPAASLCACVLPSTQASAQRTPSIAAETIPPAYPAPSPHGNNPRTSGCCNVSGSRGMRTGDEVRDSTATTAASLVA